LVVLQKCFDPKLLQVRMTLASPQHVHWQQGIDQQKLWNWWTRAQNWKEIQVQALRVPWISFQFLWTFNPSKSTRGYKGHQQRSSVLLF